MTQDVSHRNLDPYYLVSVKVGESYYKCSIGYFDKERDLAALIVDKVLLDRDGNEFEGYPEIADVRPSPGQALGVLVEQHLTGTRGPRWRDDRSETYICFTYGYVSLLRGGQELLFALSGILAEERDVGAAVFDERGKIYGIVTDYLRHYVDPAHRHIAVGSGCFIAFSPVYECRKEMLLLESGEAKPTEPAMSSGPLRV